MIRRSHLLGFVVAAALVAAAAATWIMWEPAIAPITPPAPSSFDLALTTEGARVAALGDCAVCHTAKGGKPYAGGLPLATPFGTIYSTNLTPDVESGIGNWSLAAFSRAMRRGISRDGHQLYPAFPYLHFTRMSDRDIEAAYAYLMRREPVRADAPANALIFPLNFRPLVAFWNILFLRAGEQAPEPDKGEAWNRGRLLVDGLGHCSACHTPLNLIGGEKHGKSFDGAVIDGWEAPALNQLANAVIPWTNAQLVSYLRTGIASQHGAAAGPMLPVTRELAHVPESDVDAIATYLLSIQKAPLPRPVPSSVSKLTPTEKVSVQRGGALFSASCASCHGQDSPMQAVGGRPSLATSTAVNALTATNVIQTMLQGVPWNGEDAIHYMPPFADTFNDDQLADMTAYLRAQYAKALPWTDVQQTIQSIKKKDASR